MSNLADLTSPRVIKTVDPIGVVRHYEGLSIARAVTETSMEYLMDMNAVAMQCQFQSIDQLAINTVDELGNQRVIYVKPRIEFELKLRLPGSNE